MRKAINLCLLLVVACLLVAGCGQSAKILLMDLKDTSNL